MPFDGTPVRHRPWLAPERYRNGTQREPPISSIGLTLLAFALPTLGSNVLQMLKCSSGAMLLIPSVAPRPVRPGMADVLRLAK